MSFHFVLDLELSSASVALFGSQVEVMMCRAWCLPIRDYPYLAAEEVFLIFPYNYL